MSEARKPGRPRGTCGPVRAALVRALAAGVSGPLDVLAEHTGWPPERVRYAVKRMRRTGELAMVGEPGRAGGGRPAGVYSLAPAEPDRLDVLSFARQVWR